MRLSVFMPALVAAAPNQIQGVIKQLEQMAEDATTAQNEANAFHAKNVASLNAEIARADDAAAKAKDAKDVAAAQFEDAKTRSANAADAIKAAQEAIAHAKDNIKAERSNRKADREVFEKNVADAQLGIVACNRLIDALDDVSDKNTEFLQAQLKSIHSGSKTMTALMQAVEELKQPKVIYKKDDKFKAIVNLIEQLQTELTRDKAQLESQEKEQQAATSMAVQNEENTVKNQTNEERVQSEKKATADSDKADAQAENATQTKEMKAQKKLATVARSTLGQSEADYEQADTARTSEITAINRAVEILSNDQAAAQGASFLQVKRSSDDGKDKAISFLRNKASSIHSKVLLMLTEVATQDPFAKVKGLIQDLLDKLASEAAASQSKHDRCVKEMNENKAQIDEAESNVRKLTTEINREQATFDKKTAEVEECIAALAQNADDRTKAIADFTERDQQLTESIATGKSTHEALQAAIEVLQGGAAAGAAGGPGFEGTGGLGQVIQFLEDVQQRQHQSNEASQKELDDLKTEHDDNLMAQKEAEEAKEAQKKAAEKAAAEATENLTTAKESLQKENTNLDGFKEIKMAIDADCVAKGASHEENKAKREEEIQSLKEALEILESSS